MNRFEEGDRVVFPGDPKRQEYEVVYVNDDGGSVDLDTPEAVWSYVPVRLLAPAPTPLKPGQVWKHPDGRLLFVVSSVSSTVFRVALTGEATLLTHRNRDVQDNFTLVRDA